MKYPTARYLVWLVLSLALLHSSAGAVDWPTYRGDRARSGRSSDPIDVPRLRLLWEHRTGTIPQTAWSGAAKYDAFGQVPNLKSMRNYDPVYHPVISGQRVYFGSSADHTVHCLDVGNGQKLWSYTTDGPVRIAPTVANDRVYFGSDDGNAYCLSAATGMLLWKYAPPVPRQQIIHEGNLISSWPCRTGILVDGGIAYAAFSLFPWQTSYVAALNALTGKPEGKDCFLREYPGLTFEGPLLASSSKLIFPQGRVAPLLFHRSNGDPLGSLPGGGGCMVLLGDDGRVFHGPGNKSGEIYVSQEDSRAKVANYPGAVSMVVTPKRAFVLTERELLSRGTTANDGSDWKIRTLNNLELILAGEALFLGGADSITAVRASDGELVWEGKVQGRAYGLAASEGKLVTSTDEGNLYCFAAAEAESPQVKPLANADPGESATRQLVPTKSNGTSETTGFAPSVGPYLRFVSPSRAVVEWQTAQECPSLLYFHDAGKQTAHADAAPKKRHKIEIDGLRKDVLYHYQLAVVENGIERRSAEFECDMFFNHASEANSGTQPDSKADPIAESILSAVGTRRGICVDLGCNEGRLAESLARLSSLRVIAFDTDAAKVASARKRLQNAGLYGTRVVVHHVAALDEIPSVEQFADLIVSDRLASESSLDIRPDTLRSLLRPDGAAVLTRNKETSHELVQQPSVKTVDEPTEGTLSEVNGWWIWKRKLPDGTGVWTHQYGTEDNSGYGGESLAGASSAEEMRVQWFGRPGPRAQADRNGRKPSPLSAGGRLFHQGLNRITALNAYNGTILWTLEIPNLERFNVPRDSANWCADESHVFAVVRDRCWKIQAADGVVADFVQVLPGQRKDWNYEWGYVARTGNLLLGSSVKEGSRHTNFWGGAGWYDDKFGEATYKVCSDRLFALDVATGQERWSYQSGLIINSTITAAANRIYFVESRHPESLAVKNHRVGIPELWLDQYLVAIDIESGRKAWEQPIDTADGLVIFHLAANAEKLVLLASEHRYNLYAFSTSSGTPLWTQSFDWQSDNHGGHMSRPAIVGDKVFVRPRVLDLKTGKLLAETMPGGGCGSYAATDKSLLFRAGNVTMWDMTDSTTTSWNRLRPDCWISTIPAAGLILSPEGGGGCSCGSWMETSIAFAPDRYPPPRIRAAASKFIDSVSVALEARGTADEIRYTLDGTEPTPASPRYEKPFELTASSLLKARSYWQESGGQGKQSVITTRNFTRDYPPPTASPRGTPFIDQLEVTLALPGTKGTIHFTLDGSEPDGSSPVYRSPLKLDATTTVKARVISEDGTAGPTMSAEYHKVESKLREPVVVDSLQPGLVCQSFEGSWKEIPKFAGLSPRKTTTVSEVSLAARSANDAFALKFAGFLHVPTDGVYKFYTKSDDGSRLLIGDEKVVDNDGIHAAVEKSGWIALKAGRHPIMVEYWDALWGEFLEVTFEGPGIARQPLPPNALFHKPD